MKRLIRFIVGWTLLVPAFLVVYCVWMPVITLTEWLTNEDMSFWEAVCDAHFSYLERILF